jgi:hypothetical protein
MMKGQWVIAVIAMVIAFLLLVNRRLPAIIVLLAFGVAASLILNPDLIDQLRQISVQFRLPYFSFGKISWQDFILGALVLGVP